METRRSGKESMRKTRAAGSAGLILKDGPKFLYNKGSPSPARRLQKIKKLKRHIIKPTDSQPKDKSQDELSHDIAKRRSLPLESKPQTTKGADGQSKSPGIRTRLSTGSIHMNGTMTISTAKERAEQENILKQIEKDVASSAITSTKKRSNSSGTDVPVADPPPPKKRKIGRNDGSGEDNRNDYYCWLCHKEGIVVCCELCPRVYHTKCLELAGELPNDWVCPECEKIMRAECTDTRSKSMEMLTLDQLCSLLMYALERMNHAGSEPFQKPVDMALVPTYSDYIFNPMDLDTLEKNIKKRIYGSTEAFMSDTKWILHNCIIYNGAHHKLTGSAKMIVKICKHEMNEIELCPDCYLNSCIRRNDEWFSELCRTPHTLVWAKLKGYPFWPAKALREEEGQVDVRFFGAHDRSWVPVSQCFLLSKNIPTSLQKGKKNNGLDGAIDELNKHVQKLKEKYGNFEYAPFRTPYDKTDCYKPTSFKLNSPSTSNKPLAPVVIPTRNQPSLLKRAKLSCKTAAAVRNKYNAIVSLKKVEASPEKMAKWLNPGGEIRKLSVENPDNVSDKVSGPSNSEIHETIDPSSTSKNKEGNCVASNVKKSFVSMSIVEKVEQKIQGITDTQEEENCEKSDSVVTESVEVSGGTAEREDNGEMSGSVHPNIDNDQTKITDSSCKDGPVNDDKTADSAESDNTVSCVTQTAHEITDNNDKDNVVSTEKSNTPTSTNIKTNTLLSSLQSKCDNQTGSEGKKDLFQEKLKATIENCKEKVGVTDVSDDQGNAEESTDPDTMDTDEEEEPLSLQLDQSPDVREEEMETEDTSSQIFSESSQADESGEGAKLDDTGEVSEDVVQTDDKPVKSSDNNNEKSGNDAVVLSSDDSPDKMLTRKTVDLSSKEVIDISDNATEDCGKAEENSGSKNNLVVEQDPMGKELKNNDKEKLGQNAALEQKKQLQDANITERKTDYVAGKSSTENKEISDTRNPNDNGISKKVSQEVNKQSSEEESSGKVFNTSTKSSFPGGNITTEIVKKLPIRTQVAEVNISEDDSDIEKLVIDLDSEKESPSKFSSKGGEVKSVSGFKHGTSPLVSPVFSRSDTKITNKQPTTKIMNSKNNSVKGRNSNDSATTTKIITDNQAGSQKRNGVTDDHVTSQKKVGVNTKLATGGLKTALPKGFTTKKSKSPEKGVPSSGIIMFSDSDSNSSKNKKSTKTHSDQEKKNLTIEKVGELPLHTADVIPRQSRASEEISGKFLKRIMSSVQKNFDEMMEEFQQQTQVPSNEEILKAAEGVKWNCKNELLELKHNFDLTVSEMRASWEAQKEQLTKALSVKHFKELQAQKQALQKEKDEAVDHAKRRQWCANCQKEAIFYCCWNTSYCDYPCQQAHWPQHAMTCMQTNKRQSTENGDKGESSSAQNQKSVISDTVVGSAGDQNSNPVVPSSSLPKSTSSFRLLPEPIATAIRREEEKRGETRATPNSTFVPIPSPVLQNIHPGQIKLAQPSSNMMPHVPGNVFLNRGMPPRPVSQPTISNSMLVQQPILQQTVYPVQLQRQQTPYNNSMLFPQANPAQQNILGYPRHQF